MSEAIGIRIDDETIRKIEYLQKEDATDRSTILRKLIYEGYSSLMKKRAAEQYREGKITFSEAAHQAGLTLWEMQQFLVGQGYVSNYSTEDLKRESVMLNL